MTHFANSANLGKLGMTFVSALIFAGLPAVMILHAL
jgi:hypothetical protein